MSAAKLKPHLTRSKSTGFMDKLEKDYDFKCFLGRFCGYSEGDNRHTSVSSIDACSESDGFDLSAEENKLDSGIGRSLLENETLFVLEQKVAKLGELLQEQHTLLKSVIKKVIHFEARSNYQFNAGEVSIENDSQREPKSTTETIKIEKTMCDNVSGPADANCPAQTLLNAIEPKREDMSLNQIIRTALENFLQNDGLKEHVAAVTAECVEGVVRGSFTRVLSNAYLPMVERSHRRLIRHVTKLLEESFQELEESSASLFKSIHKTSRSIRMSLETHQNLLEATDPARNMNILQTTLKQVLEEDLKAWRGRLVEELAPPAQSHDCSYESECSPESLYSDSLPMSPQQPANPETSIIDSLMKRALINKHMAAGDVNAAFEEALGAADLALVVAACRAAPPQPHVLRLRTPLLLSLLQQLATDMVHDTHLKCRFLEEAIISLAESDEEGKGGGRAHLPLVVGEVRRHLSRFLRAYPKHHARRRVALIIMAANNLLK